MSLPQVDVIRQRIESVRRDQIRYCLVCGYLFAARISELVSKASPSDNTVARGPRGKDCYATTYNDRGNEVEAVVFRIQTAKRQGLERLIALPLDSQFEPWSQPLYRYFQERGEDHVFPFTRQKIWRFAKQAFEGLTYPIQTYRITKKSLGIKKVVDRHLRPFRLHALRHIRTAELIEVYGLDGIDLSAYGGWTLRSMIGVGSSMDRYAHLRWQRYFPKLLRKRG